MATHSSVLAWRIPGMGEPRWAALYGVAQSRTRLKPLSSSSISKSVSDELSFLNFYIWGNIDKVVLVVAFHALIENSDFSLYMIRKSSPHSFHVLGFPGDASGEEPACLCRRQTVPELGRSPGEGIGYLLQYSWASLVVPMVKNPPAMPETWV